MLVAPWVLSKQERSVVREVFEKFRTPTRTMRSMKDCFTTDGDLSGLKTHEIGIKYYRYDVLMSIIVTTYHYVLKNS